MPEVSDRQREVLAAIRERDGPTRQELADALDVKPTTVEYHMGRLEEQGYEFD